MELRPRKIISRTFWFTYSSFLSLRNFLLGKLFKRTEKLRVMDTNIDPLSTFHSCYILLYLLYTSVFIDLSIHLKVSCRHVDRPYTNIFTGSTKNKEFLPQNPNAMITPKKFNIIFNMQPFLINFPVMDLLLGFI